MDHKGVSESTSPSMLSDNPSNIVGLLPPDELDEVIWSEAYTIPQPCIHNEQEYEPAWDCRVGEAGGWVSRHIESGRLYDMNGSSIDAPKQSAMAVAVRLFKKYW